MNYTMVRFKTESLSPEIETLRIKHNLFLSYVGLSRGLLPLLRKLKKTIFTGPVRLFGFCFVGFGFFFFISSM